METRIIVITFIDGREYRVFCANRTQIDKVSNWYHSNREVVKSFDFVLSGIHTASQFLNIMDSESK
jgi:hypothetical protein